MNVHKNARLTLIRRMELVQDILVGRLAPCAATATYGVSLPTARKWLGRYLAEGEAGLLDRPLRPRRSPQAIGEQKALGIVELRRRRLTQARIAASLGVSKSTVARMLARAGLSRLRDIEPSAPVVRYEHRHCHGQSETPHLGKLKSPHPLTTEVESGREDRRARGRCRRPAGRRQRRAGYCVRGMRDLPKLCTALDRHRSTLTLNTARKVA